MKSMFPLILGVKNELLEVVKNPHSHLCLQEGVIIKLVEKEDLYLLITDGATFIKLTQKESLSLMVTRSVSCAPSRCEGCGGACH